jgi:hypothetical protein
MVSSGEPPKTAKKPDRKGRLAAELRANLQRRKAQAKARRAGAADERPDGLGATTEKARSAQDG